MRKRPTQIQAFWPAKKRQICAPAETSPVRLIDQNQRMNGKRQAYRSGSRIRQAEESFAPSLTVELEDACVHRVHVQRRAVRKLDLSTGFRDAIVPGAARGPSVVLDMRRCLGNE